MGVKKISLGALAIVLGTCAIALPSAKPVSLYATQVMHNSRKAEADRLFKLGEQQIKSNQPKAALESFQKALPIYQQINERLAEGHTRRSIGNAYYLLKDYPQAIAHQQQALSIAREIKNPDLEARALFNLGSANAGQGNTAKAIDYYQQSLAIARANQNRELELKALSNLAQNNPRKAEADRLLEQGADQGQSSQFEAALRSFQQALLIYREIKDREGEGNALNNLGVAYYILEDYSKADQYYKQSLAIARENQNRELELKALSGLAQNNPQKAQADKLFSRAIQQFENNQFKTASQSWEQALLIYQEIKDPLDEGKTLGSLGLVYNILGYYLKAIECNQQSLAIAQAMKDREGEGKVLINLGVLYKNLGDYPKAIEYLQQSLVITREIQDLLSEAQALGNLGISHNHLGDYPKAIEYLQQGLMIVQKIKDREFEGKTLGNLGNAYKDLGDYPKAIDFQQRWLAIAQEIKDRQSEGAALGNLGTAYYSQGNYPKAIDYYKQALAIIREINDPQGEGIVLNNLGSTFYKQGNLKLAEKTLFEGIKVRESLRERELKDSNKVSIFETQSNTYRTLQQVLIAQNKTDAALEIAERGRARAFVELLSSKLSPNPQQRSPLPPTIEEIKQIAKTQNATLVQYSIIYDYFKVADKSQTKESKLYIWVIKPTGEITFHSVDLTPLHQKNTSLSNLVTDTRVSIAKNANAVGINRSPNTFKEGDRVILKNDRSKDPPWIVVAVNNDTLTLRQPSYPPGQTSDYPITDVVEKVAEKGSQSSANAKDRKLQQLYQLLIEPIAKFLPTQEDARVIFIPQQELFAVPFPALQDPIAKRAGGIRR